MNSAVVKLPPPATARPAPPPARVLVVGTNIYHDSMEWHVVDALRALGCATEFFAARGFGGTRSVWQKALQKRSGPTGLSLMPNSKAISSRTSPRNS